MRKPRDIDAELKALRARRGELEPVEVELSEDIPALYRAHVEDLVQPRAEHIALAALFRFVWLYGITPFRFQNSESRQKSKRN